MPPPRLSAVDASFLYLEQPRTPMHVGAVGIFRAPARRVRLRAPGRRLVERRLVAVPRYRQKVRHVPGELARPVWVDDADFDVAFHVRRSALPRPGHRRPAHRAGRPADVAAARPGPPAVGGLPRRGARRRPLRDHHQDPPGDGRRRHDDRHRAGAARPVARTRARLPDELWMPRPSRRTPPRRGRGGGGDRPARPGGRHVRATANDALAGRRRLARGVGDAGRHGRDRRPAGARIPAQRRALHPAPVRRRPRRPRRRTGRSAPRTGAR